jgi:PAS domain S-box-containing protein
MGPHPFAFFCFSKLSFSSTGICAAVMRRNGAKMDDDNHAIRGKIAEFSREMEALGIPFIRKNEVSQIQSEQVGVTAGLPPCPFSEAVVLSELEDVTHFASSLARVFQESPDSIYVTGSDGITLMVNKSFREATGVAPEEMLGRDVSDLEKAGYFKPSVHRLVREAGRPVSVVQVGQSGKEIIVTGVPIYGSKGKIEMCVSSARPIDEIEKAYKYHIRKKTKPSQEQGPEQVGLISESLAMRRILDLIEQIKDTDSNILITGESGVGKGVLTRYIHKRSNRAKFPLVEINCGAIPEHLLESELFGYDSGAFTGASSAGKEGQVEMAAGGTLLLDEISELPRQMQVKLLQFIQEKRFLRIGGKQPVSVDVRIIAASNKDLRYLVDHGDFRADLFYRLNVIHIEVPPLRERRDDIPKAAAYFLERFQEKYKKQVVCSEAFLADIKSKTWPGNMRELENSMERLVLTNKEDVVLSAHSVSARKNPYEAMADIDDTDLTLLRDMLEKLEERVVQAAYKKYRSSYKVAESLGISQTSAYRKIRKYVGE